MEQVGLTVTQDAENIHTKCNRQSGRPEDEIDRQTDRQSGREREREREAVLGSSSS